MIAPDSASRTSTLTAVILFASSLAILVPWAPLGFTNGDAAVYAQQMKSLDFEARAVHVGYISIGSVLTVIFPAWEDIALNWLSCLLGAATVVVVFLIARTSCQTLWSSVVAGMSLLVVYTVLQHCVWAEVYIAQIFFLMLALLLWLKDKPIATGLAFAVSTLVTPSTLFAGPAFIVLRPRWKPLLLMAMSGSLVLAVVIAPFYQSYFFESRGIFRAAGDPVNLPRALLKEAYEIVLGYFALLPLLIIGTWKLFASSRYRRFGVALGVLWLFSLLGEKYPDVPVQLPAYVLLALVVGLGLETAVSRWEFNRSTGGRIVETWLIAAAALVPIVVIAVMRQSLITVSKLPPQLPTTMATVVGLAAIAATLLHLSQRWRMALATLVTGLFAVNAILAFTLVGRTNLEIDDYRETALSIGETADPEFLAVAGFDRGILLEHYLFDDSYTGHWVDIWWLRGVGGNAQNVTDGQERWRSALSAGEEVWLLENYPERIEELEERGYRVDPIRDVHRATRNSSKASASSPAQEEATALGELAR